MTAGNFFDPGNCLATCLRESKALTAEQTWSPNVDMTSAQSNFDGNDNGSGDYSSSTPPHIGVRWLGDKTVESPPAL